MDKTANEIQSDAMQVLAALETAYRALQTAGGDVVRQDLVPYMASSGIKCGDPMTKLHKAMDIVQEIQRDIMFCAAVLVEARSAKKTEKEK